MRLPLSLLTAATLTLAGCGSDEVSLTNASPEEVAKEVAKSGGAAGFNPGQWETTVETLDIEIPGLPAQMKDQMAEVMKKTQTASSCITPEEANSPPAEILAASEGRCRYETFKMGGGKMDGTLKCSGEGMMGEMTMKITGTFDDDSFVIDNEVDATAPNGGPAMKIKSRSTGKRTGECTATKA